MATVNATLDLNTILVSTLSSLVAMIGSIIVAFLYIRSQNNREKKRRINEQIQETYIDQGILPTQVALQEYGTSAVFAIYDAGIWAVRALKFYHDEEFLKNKINEISTRSHIKDFRDRNYSHVTQGIQYLRRFSRVLYGSIIRTLQHYGEMCTDITTYEAIKQQIDEAGVDEFKKGTEAVAKLIEESQLYLQNRLDNLTDFIWQHEFNNYSEFLNVFKEEKYEKFITNLEHYHKLFSNVIDAMHSPEADEARKKSTLALSSWLIEQREINPLENDKVKVKVKM